MNTSKKYKRQNGTTVRVICIDCPGPTPVVVVDETGIITKHNKEGQGIWPSEDLVEILPYAEFKVDDPVMVSHSGYVWNKRHFAGVSSDGLALAWCDGDTSWSSSARQTYKWDFCRRPTREELNGCC